MVKYIEKEKRKKIYYNDRKAKGGISMTRMERLYDIARTRKPVTRRRPGSP